jgi:signal transduction histidine kinase
MRSLRLTRADLLDIALAVALAAIAVVETIAGNRDPGPLAGAIITDLLLTLPLAVRPRWPLAVLALEHGNPDRAGRSGRAQRHRRLLRRARAGLHRGRAPPPPAGVGSDCSCRSRSSHWTSGYRAGKPWWEDLEFIGGFIVAFWIVGRVVWSRRALVHRLEAQAEELRLARDAAAGAAIAGERARIARDMHDVVAHGVSVMVVHAEAAEALLDQPDRATESLRAIQRSGRAALADLRRIVGVLRAGDGNADLSPAPGLRDADQLVARLNEAGLDVTLEVRGEPRPLPDGVELAAYRVLQEALTNALRHAGPTRATATVAYGGGDITIDVRDDGPVRTRPGPPTRGGHGLDGARERLALYGGELTAGPSGAGFHVRARIPACDPA